MNANSPLGVSRVLTAVGDVARAGVRRRGLALSAVLFAAVGAAGSMAHADATAKAVAEVAFREGRTLADKGDYQAACPKLEESNRLDPALGTAYYLADCFEHIGRLASAWGIFSEVAGKAKAAGEAAKSEKARQRADALWKRVPRMTIVVTQAELPGLEVRRDGQLLSAALFASAMPVDPGSHHIEATAPNKVAFSTTVTLAEGATETVTVPALTDGASSSPSTAPTTVATPDHGGAPTPKDNAAPGPAPKPPQTPPTTSSRELFPGQLPVAIGLAAVGVVAVGIGAYVGVGAKQDFDRSKSMCGTGLGEGISSKWCTSEGAALRHDAGSAADLATAMVIGGSVAAAAGLVLLLVRPGGDERAHTSQRHREGVWAVGVSPFGMSLGGSF